MKKVLLPVTAVFFIFCGMIQAQDISGVLDSTINYTTGAGSAQTHSFGLEQFANLRLRINTGENAVFVSAFNLAVVTGNFFNQSVQNTIISGQNYAAGIELERLYFRINGSSFDTEAGLLRIPFGYSQIWGPVDFLNPRSPLSYNARPRGVLGTTFLFYPSYSTELMVFAAAPLDPFISDGGGFNPGITMEQHWNKASMQALYAYETFLPGSRLGKHRFGLSLKADLELSFTADLLYTLNPASFKGIDGLSASFGFDYSFLKGDLITIWEYLYNGKTSVTAMGYGGGFSNNHYLYGSFLYQINDYARTGVSVIYCFDDPSFSGSFFADYEVFQGFSLSLNAALPLNGFSKGSINKGELGPDSRGSRFSINLGAKLRF